MFRGPGALPFSSQAHANCHCLLFYCISWAWGASFFFPGPRELTLPSLFLPFVGLGRFFFFPGPRRRTLPSLLLHFVGLGRFFFLPRPTRTDTAFPFSAFRGPGAVPFSSQAHADDHCLPFYCISWAWGGSFFFPGPRGRPLPSLFLHFVGLGRFFFLPRPTRTDTAFSFIAFRGPGALLFSSQAHGVLILLLRYFTRRRNG